MDVYNTIIPSTTCEFSLFARFPNENLIVSKGNVLQLFCIRKLSETRRKVTKLKGRRKRRRRRRRGGKANDDKESEEEEDDIVEEEVSEEIIYPSKPFTLDLICEYTINGKITAIDTIVSMDNPNVDYLIVATETAKVSIIKWNESLHCIETVSLHYYESILDSLILNRKEKSEILHRTDPSGSCHLIALNDIIAILPFQKDSDFESQDFAFISSLPTPQEGGDSAKKRKRSKRKKRKIEQLLTPASESDFDADLPLESFVLNSFSLHEELKNIIDIQFLYSYDKPTMAVLYGGEKLSWTGYLPEKRDNLKVLVFTLDLKSRKAKPFMNFDNLPYDSDKLIPLQDPINGFIILGGNGFVHVNCLGSTKGIAVNEFFNMTSEIKLKDQSTLDLFLENSQVVMLDSNKLLLITERGVFFTIYFEKLNGIPTLQKIEKLDNDLYKNINVHSINSITNIPTHNLIFIACQGSDSYFVEYNPTTITNVPSSLLSELNEEHDSWIYYEEESNDAVKSFRFSIIDQFVNVGPCKDFSLGYISTEARISQLPNCNFKETAIVASSGLDHCSGLSIINPTIKPVLKDRLKLTAATRLWTVENNHKETQYIVSTDLKANTTDIYLITPNGYKLHKANYHNHSTTIQFGSLETDYGIKPVQVTSNKVFLYNLNFNITTRKTYEEKQINSAQIFSKYVMLIMVNGDVEVLEYDAEGKQFKEVDLPALLNYQIFTNGWMVNSTLLNKFGQSEINKKRTIDGEVKIDPTINSNLNSSSNLEEKDEVLFWLVTGDNRLLVFRKDHLERVFEFKNVHNLPQFMSMSPMDPSFEADIDPQFKQVMFTTLGDEFGLKEYLFLLTIGGEIIIYETFMDTSTNTIKFLKSNDLFGFPVIGAPENSYRYATKIERLMFKIELKGKQTIFVTGATPFMICKMTNSCPRMFKFTSKPMLSFARMNYKDCDGVVSLDDKMHIRSFELDESCDLRNQIPIKKVQIGKTIDKVAYYEPADVYVVSVIKEENYKPMDEEDEIAGWNKELRIQGKSLKSEILLISPKTWTIIDTVELGENEVCTSLEILNLMVSTTETSSNYKGQQTLDLRISNSRRKLIFVGTAMYKNEDVSTNGSWKLYDVTRVNPDPSMPERIWKLRSETQDAEVRGPVLSACPVSGRFAVVQGQRMLIRTLKDAGNAVPVAFTDTGLYSRQVKSFENLLLVSDAFQGVELFGFDAEPYRMIPLGKDEQSIPTNVAEFIVYDKNLYIICASDEGVLQLLQYDPYDAESMKGSKLCHKASMNTYQRVTKMVNVSRRRSLFSMVSTLPFRKDFDLGHEVIGCNSNGSFFRVVPIPDFQYRRLLAVQNYMDKDIQHLGLTTKMTFGGLKGRPIIDSFSIKRFLTLPESNKKAVMDRVGQGALVEVYRDIIGIQ